MNYLIKVAFFGVYMASMAMIMETLVSKLRDYIDTFPFSNWLCQFGIFTGLSLYVSIVVSYSLAKKSIDFWK